jgi:hypothetical protein
MRPNVPWRRAGADGFIGAPKRGKACGSAGSRSLSWARIHGSSVSCQLIRIILLGAPPARMAPGPDVQAAERSVKPRKRLLWML